MSSQAHPDGVVAGARDDEAVVILQAGDAPLVPVERPHKLAGAESRIKGRNSAITLQMGSRFRDFRLIYRSPSSLTWCSRP